MFSLVFGNLFRPGRTRDPGDMPAVPATFRGALSHDAARCTGCGTCAYVCAPKAISFEEDPGKSLTWNFYIGRCSFCGLCQQNCPTQAIGFATSVPVTTESTDSDGLRLHSTIPFHHCPRCGKAHIPLPPAAMASLKAADTAGFDETEKQYCPECRQWAVGARLRRSFLGEEDGGGN
jgi:hydrogenase-4 component H